MKRTGWVGKVLGIAAVFILGAGSLAHSALIELTTDNSAYIDGPQSLGPLFFNNNNQPEGQTNFNQGEGMAFHFNLDQDYQIFAIQDFVKADPVFLPPVGATTAAFDIVLYENSLIDPSRGFIPDVNSKIFGQRVSFEVNSKSADAWRELANLDLKLSSGDYWIGLEDGTRGIIATSDLRFDAVQKSVVPEPSTLGLIAMGFLGMLRRKKIS